jgi:hypothetical protein
LSLPQHPPPRHFRSRLTTCRTAEIAPVPALIEAGVHAPGLVSLSIRVMQVAVEVLDAFIQGSLARI